MSLPLTIDSPPAPETVAGYRFSRADLRVAARRPGISAFMRIRNGAAFLETSIRSHIDYFDEIVAVHNRCTDETPAILASLQTEYGPERLRVIHYTDPVFPPGSEGHIRTPADAPCSLVNYYNFALASTRCQYATKLDDDHLAISTATGELCDALRQGEVDPGAMHCFSGLNLMRRPDGSLGIYAREPFSGGGDIGIFRVTPQTYFTHDRRFERFQRGDTKRIFAGFLYWHLKFLKDDMGFANYDLSANPASRYAKRKAVLDKAPPATLELAELAAAVRPGWIDRCAQWISEKRALVACRNAALASAFPFASVSEAVAGTTQTRLHQHVPYLKIAPGSL